LGIGAGEAALPELKEKTRKSLGEIETTPPEKNQVEFLKNTEIGEGRGNWEQTKGEKR